MKTKLIISSLFFCINFLVLGLNETYTVRDESAAITTTNSINPGVLVIEDGKFNELSGNPAFTDLKTTLRVTLGLHERSNFGFISNFTDYQVKVKVSTYDINGTFLSVLPQQILMVSYNPSGFIGGLLNLDFANTFTHSDNIHKYEIEYERVSTGAQTPQNIYLEAELEVERYYELAPTRPSVGYNYITYDNAGIETKALGVYGTSIPNDVNRTGQEIEIYWNYIVGAEEYELEWTWVDNFGNSINSTIAASALEFSGQDFERNNTRIITNMQSFRIPVIYDKGYIIYRVRGVGRWLGNQGVYASKNIKKFGRWSSDDDVYDTNSEVMVLDWAPHFIELSSSHEAIKNWQFQVVYAEEGKKKEIVTYFDGSLRNRQTVTKINSNNEAIVGESVYDNQGRPAVQILPTPVGNPSLRYFYQLNKNTSTVPNPNGSVFTHHDFDWDDQGGTIANAPQPMSPVSGASKYYSNNNTPQDNWQDQVPKANGFPYVQTEYTPDNTGRIKKQGGVGDNFKVNESHATKYLYGQPSQEELNRLFGYEVGHKSRYKKNMVIDANGQVSISFLDPQGRVIATALTGDATGSLLPLELGDYAVVTNYLTDLLAKANIADVDMPSDDNILYSSGNNNSAIDGLKANTEILNGVDDNEHIVDYKIQTGEYIDPCIPGMSFPYSYILDITFTNEDGGSEINVYDRTDNIGSNTQLGINGVNGIHEIIDGNQNYNYTFDKTLGIGSFTSGKSLVVNPVKLEEHAALFLSSEDNTCLSDYSAFLQDNTNSGEGCEDDLPPGSAIVVNDCSVSHAMLLIDISPGGQYGSKDPNDLLSIFSTVTGLNIGFENTAPAWKSPLSSYLDPYGNQSYVTVNYDNTLNEFTPEIDLLITANSSVLIPVNGIPNQYQVKPEHLENAVDFLNAWESSWAESLVAYHPEYCYTEMYDGFCTMTSNSCGNANNEIISSDNFDNQINSISTYADAASTNNFFGQILIPDNSGVFQLKNVDPFFCIDYPELDWSGTKATQIKGTMGALMEEILLDYKHSQAPNAGFTLWEFAIKAVLCGSNLSSNCGAPTTLPYSLNGLGLTIEQKDQIWNIYKNLYLAEKRKIKQLFINFSAIAKGCYNGYIGGDNMSVSLIQSFSEYPEFYGAIGSNTPLTSNLNTPNYTAGTYDGLLEFLDAAEQELLSQNGCQYPWFNSTANFPQHQSLFADKLPRFLPIDHLYDSSLPDDVIIENGSNQSAYSVLKSTGRCPLSFSLESFISGLAEDGSLTGQTNANMVPELTVKLYESMGGTVSTSPNPVNVNGSASGNNLTITVTNPNNGQPLTTNIILTKEPSHTWSWSAIQSFKYVYYVPNSLSGGIYSFKVIANVLVGNSIVEYVISGQTGIAIGECDITPECDDLTELGNNLGAIFSELVSLQMLNTNIPGFSISNVANNWFLGSVLQNQVAITNPLNSIVSNDPTNGTFTVSKDYDLSVNFGSYPLLSTISFISGYQLTESSTPGVYELEILYIDNNGINTSIVGQLNLADQVNPSLEIEIHCGCEASISIFTNNYELFLNDVITSIQQSNSNDINNYYSTILNTNLVDFIQSDFPSGSIPIYANLDTYLNYWFISESGKPCEVQFDFSNPTAPNATSTQMFHLLTVSDVNITVNAYGEIVNITAMGYFSGGHFYEIKTNLIGCMIIPISCEPCTPELQVPQSCQTQYGIYSSAIATLNNPINAAGGPTLFPVLTEEEFCNSNLAYAVEGYLYYLNNRGISSPHDDFYVTMGEFINTQLNSGYASITDVVDAFTMHIDVNGLNPTDISWNTYVDDVYMYTEEGLGICSPALLPNIVTFDLIEPPCDPNTGNVDIVNATNQYGIYIQNQIAAFKQRYIEGALATVVENFEVTRDDKQYHYTLYYYDQAGNLVQTVPPKGARILKDANINNAAINSERLSNPATPTPNISSDPALADVIPDHILETQYKYNSLNQLVWQKTPDGGISEFAYDKLGRLVLSQNAKQANASGLKHASYTVYDPLGRIVEVGELTFNGTYSFNDGQLFLASSPTAPVQLSEDPTFPLNITAVDRREVTVTMHDRFKIPSNIFDIAQFKDYESDNTRNRITGVLYFDTYASSNTYSGYQNATLYDYDVHGNVKEIIQDIQDDDLLNSLSQTNNPGQNIKKTNYTYDLVSGNVKEVKYQEGEVDQFTHRYCYDADNRITIAETSNDNLNWEKDAKYFYYNHGPLARAEIGENKVQSCDYAYTIQGWLKGVNSENLVTSRDQGKDGYVGGSHTEINKMNAKDVSGYSLHYFDGDYTGRLNNNFLALSEGITPIANYDLFNGNIKEMYTASTKTNEDYLGTSHTWYKYDQLNRIRSMKQEELTLTSPIPAYDNSNGYASDYTYDANGNLQSLDRYSKTAASQQQFDKFVYSYYDNGTNTGDDGDAGPNVAPMTNRLSHVHDNTAFASFQSSDIDGQLANNYRYDAIGQLVKDVDEGIDEIEWKVNGKVKRIDKSGNDNDIEFEYDAMGNRIIKSILASNGDLISKDYYIRDAQGNVMSIYHLEIDKTFSGNITADALTLSEQYIYGSSRLGSEQPNTLIATSNASIPVATAINSSTNMFTREIGDKRYELANHLGNVLQVITDRKLAIDEGVYDHSTGLFASTSDNVVDFYSPDVVSQSDYTLSA